jgi:hypothetical protein
MWPRGRKESNRAVPVTMEPRGMPCRTAAEDASNRKGIVDDDDDVTKARKSTWSHRRWRPVECAVAGSVSMPRLDCGRSSGNKLARAKSGGCETSASRPVLELWCPTTAERRPKSSRTNGAMVPMELSCRGLRSAAATAPTERDPIAREEGNGEIMGVGLSSCTGGIVKLELSRQRSDPWGR